MNIRKLKKRNAKDQYEHRVNRKYKDSLFRKIFSDRKDLLDLYNALNDTQYTDEEELTVTTLEDVIYVSIKNDVSFLLGGTMNLYEHQSSYNPNMPIRGLIYFARLYQNYIDECEINVFSPVLKHLPRPKFIVFYNGSKDEPDQKLLRLTDGNRRHAFRYTARFYVHVSTVPMPDRVPYWSDYKAFPTGQRYNAYNMPEHRIPSDCFFSQIAGSGS